MDPLNNFWQYLITNYPPIYHEFVFPYFSVLLSFFIPTLIIAFIEVNDLVPEFILKTKIQPDKKVTRAEVWRCFKNIFTQFVFVIGPLYAFGFTQMASLIGFGRGVVPAWYVVCAQIFFCMVVEDFCMYWGHRWLHHPLLYKHVHALHHRYTAPFGMTGLYAHPVEVIVLGFCSFVGPIILRPHMLVFFIWIHVKQWMTIHNHSGYEIPLVFFERYIPFKGDVEFHDFHHKTYGPPYGTVFTLWDKLFNENFDYDAVIAVEHKKRAARQAREQRDLAKGESSDDDIQGSAKVKAC